MAINIEVIPKIMRHKGWTRAAALMERWFALPKSIKPNFYPVPDTETITMDWVLGYKRALDKYSEIFDKSLWATPKAREALASMLRKTGYLPTPNPRPFDWYYPVEKLDGFSTQFHPYVSKKLIDPLDDLYGALGSFTFKLGLCGTVSPAAPGPGYDVVLDKILIYVHDSFDFEEDQPLGYWSEKKMDVYRFPLFGDYVENKNFRDWRQNGANGGDFEIFSDVKVVNPRSSIKIRNTSFTIS